MRCHRSSSGSCGRRYSRCTPPSRPGMRQPMPWTLRPAARPSSAGSSFAGHVYGEARALPAAWWEQKQAVIAAPGARFASVAFVTGGLDRVKSREAFLNLARAVQGPLLVAYGGETPPKSRPEIDALAALPSVQSVMTAAGKLALYEEYPD
jgi:hypothetical protein